MQVDLFTSHFKAHAAVFKMQGPVNSLWLFRTVRLLKLSLVINVEQSHVYQFQAADRGVFFRLIENLHQKRLYSAYKVANAT